jgi:deoxyhypusine synthase
LHQKTLFIILVYFIEYYIKQKQDIGGTMTGNISTFLKEHFLHFNAATVIRAAEEYKNQLKAGNKMMITMAGAMSTAELGKSLAEMIRQDKVQAITCTGANLEEDVYNLVAHSHYKQIPNYRDLSPEQEMGLLKQQLNRVTDTCIPEEEAMRRIERPLIELWKKADAEGKSKLPHEFFYELLLSGVLKEHYEIDPKNSWLLAAAEKNLPLFVPGWEDSTNGNMFVARFKEGKIKNLNTVKGGLHYMNALIDWYAKNAGKNGIGFYQIGGGITGDFPICVVPLLLQDMKKKIPLWSYFCQISDSTTSYGSYSGATPNEKITWAKLHVTTPKFVIESDATIVAPLMFAYIMDW